MNNNVRADCRISTTISISQNINERLNIRIYWSARDHVYATLDVRLLNIKVIKIKLSRHRNIILRNSYILLSHWLNIS